MAVLADSRLVLDLESGRMRYNAGRVIFQFVGIYLDH